jgi:iron complex transport system permease protein
MNIATSVRDYRHIIILTGLGILLVAFTLLSLTVGAVSVPLKEVAIILLQKIGLFRDVHIDNVHEVVLSSIRIPRILMTIIIGGALGISGAALQGLFRNPLVEPSLIGVSGGAAAAVVLFIVFGGLLAVPTQGIFYESLMSFVSFGGGLLATILVMKLSNQEGRTNIAILILIGVAINAMAGAIIGVSIFYADENQLRTFTFWTLGDLGGANWDKLSIGIPLLLISSLGLLFYSRVLNAFSLGESVAYHLGVDTERSKTIIIVLSALCVGVSVSLAGMIGFIGLVVPHIIRVSFFPDNRLVLPASILTGALLLLISDIVARTIVNPSELPIGVVTSLIGAPFFIGLLLNAKKKSEL